MVRRLATMLTVVTLAAAVNVSASSDDLIPTFNDRLRDALGQLEIDGDFDAAAARVGATFDLAIASVPGGTEPERTVLRDCAFACRFVDLLADADPACRTDLTAFLLDNLDLARSVAFVTRSRSRQTRNATLAVLDRLRRERGSKLNTYATLAAAICVVHDRPVTMRVNENVARAPDPVHVFDYYATLEDRMFYGVRKVPAELLVYVVDVAASIDEMTWALDRYGGDGRVGKRFFEIEYDYDHFRKGTAKKVTTAGWNLRNVLRYGGVCADQAYYAVTVGKAIGIPAAYTRGAAADSRHAWVGYLDGSGKRAWWNSTSGRYDVYRGVAGLVIDPQDRKTVDDSDLALLSDFGQTPELDRQFAAAAVDAIGRLRRRSEAAAAPLPAATNGDAETPAVVRSASLTDQLELLELGLRRCPSYARGWHTMASLSQDRAFTDADRKRWGEVLDRLCGDRYPDFYVSILVPMIKAVNSPEEQNRLWNAAFGRFSRRPDLAACVRLHQARLWREHGDHRREGRCYEDIVNRYVNAGPFVLEALERAGKLLRDAGEGGRLLALYDRAWSRAEVPDAKALAFLQSSNWYQIGTRYAGVLDEAGRAAQAESVRASLRRHAR